MNIWKKQIPFILLILSMTILGASSMDDSSLQNDTNTPIEHLIVVMQQNHTFDNYFGTYPGVDGLPPDICLPVSLSDPDNPFCVASFNIGEYPISDLAHGATIFVEKYNDGQMNGFVDALNRRHQDGTLTMGYFDDRDLPYYWNLADQYVLFDSYFSSAHTGSIMNRMFWVSGTPGSDVNRLPEGGYGDIPTIFDRLQERGISWKFYINNYDPGLNYRSLAELDYLPPQVQWVPLLNYDRFLDDPELSSRIVDLDEYYVDLENGTLPAVSYVLLLGATEHPIADVGLGERLNRTMIQMLMQSEMWESSAYMITYDDWGGWYDHVPPPVVDQYGYGFRVPAMLVSPYARQGHIDHTLLDHTSILKFIESNWDIPPLGERDANANNFLTAFDFSSPPRPAVFISTDREPPPTRAEPRRNVIYITYGTAMSFALLTFYRARARSKEDPTTTNME
jgi:phospholipase C